MLQKSDHLSETEKIEYAKSILIRLGFKVDYQWDSHPLTKEFDYLGWRYHVSFGFSLYDGTLDNSGTSRFWFWGKSSGHKIQPGDLPLKTTNDRDAELYNTFGIEPIKKTKLDRYNHFSLRSGREEAFDRAVEELKSLFAKMNIHKSIKSAEGLQISLFIFENKEE